MLQSAKQHTGHIRGKAVNMTKTRKHIDYGMIKSSKGFTLSLPFNAVNTERFYCNLTGGAALDHGHDLRHCEHSVCRHFLIEAGNSLGFLACVRRR